MQTIRFSKVVESCGEPESYLLLMDPAKDRKFQAAVKAERVMTVLQPSVGTKTDRGLIGFEPGPTRQFLVFPKTLRPFKGRAVVGIKYDLLHADLTPAREPAIAAAPAKKRTPMKKTPPARKSELKAVPAAPEPPPKDEKMIAFKESEREEDEEETVPVLKRRVRHAMSLLEEGKAVAAFNLLKRIVNE